MRNWILLLLLTGIAAAQTTVYLPDPNAALFTVTLSTCTNANPIVCTSTAPHGLSTNDAVWIEGVTGNTNADGFFTVTVVDTTHFSLAHHLYFSTVPAGNASPGGTGKLTPLKSYTLVAHPRVLLDGPTGTQTGSLAGKAIESNRFFTYLRTAYQNFAAGNTYQTTGVDSFDNGSAMVRYANAAVYWQAMGKTDATALAVAKWGVNHFEQIITGAAFHCDLANPYQCNVDDTHMLLGPSEESFYTFVNYSIIHDQLTSAERSNFADKIFNDNALVRNASSPSFGGGNGGISSDPLTSCTNWPSGQAWNQSLHYCGWWWYINHEADPAFAAPGQYANFPTDYAPSYPWAFDDFPHVGNHGMQHWQAITAAALALADDDPRARMALTQSFTYQLKWRLSAYLSQHTGFTENGSRYQVYVDDWIVPGIVLMLRQATGGAYDLQGTWEHRLLPNQVYGLLPGGGGPYINGDSFIKDKWVEDENANPGYAEQWFLPTLRMSTLHPSDPLVPYAYWEMKNITDNFNTWNWTDGVADMFLHYDPNQASTALTGLGTQYLFKDTSLAACQTLWGSQLAAATGSITTDTPGCYTNMAFQHAISKSDWTTSGTHVLINSAWAGNTDRAAAGPYGAYHIFRQGYLLAGNGAGTDVGNASGGSRGNSSEPFTDDVIALGGNNWVDIHSSANVNAGGPSFSRWAGANPTGDSQSRFVYTMADLTPTYATAGHASRVNRHVIHFKKASTQDYVVSYDDIATSSGLDIRAYWHFSVLANGGSNTVSVSTAGKTVSNTEQSGNAKLNSSFLPVSGFALLDNGTSRHTHSVYTCPSSDGSTCNTSATSAEWIAVHRPALCAGNCAAQVMPTLTQPTCSASGGNCTAVQIGDASSAKVAAFARQGALLTGISFTTTHSGTAQYLIAGLSPDTYTITAPSASPSSCTVVTGDNTCYFEATAGSVTLTGGGGPGDITPPTCTLTAPATGTVSGTVSMTATASDDVGVTSVDFRYGTTVISTDTTAPYTASWDTTAVANNSYPLTCVAHDAAGNTGTSPTVTVTVANLPPPLCSTAGFRCVGSGKAYSTIQAATNAAASGDTIIVFAGDYADFSVSMDHVTVKVNPGDTVTISHTTTSQTDWIRVYGAYDVIDGFEVLNSPRFGIRAATTDHVTIQNNKVHNNYDCGIFTAFAPYVLIQNNETYLNGYRNGSNFQHGIYISNSDTPNDFPVVRGNNSHNNYGSGLQLNGDFQTTDGSGATDGVISGAIIENNLIHDNGGKGFSLISVQGATVRNNVMYNDGGAGEIHFATQAGTHTCNSGATGCTDGHSLDSNNNVVVNNTIGGSTVAAIRITDGINNVMFNNILISSNSSYVDETGGPNYYSSASTLTTSTGLFTNYAGHDYHLAPGSAAIGHGVATYQSQSAPSLDIVGVTRPQGGSYDSGAYEYPMQSNPIVPRLNGASIF